MEIRNNVNTPNTNFRAIMVPKANGCQKRFMIALREECSTEQLLKVFQTLEKEVKNKNHAILEDVGYMAGSPCNGHLWAKVNNKTYWNTDVFPFVQSIPRFMKKISNKAGKYLTKAENIERKAIDLEHKAERIRVKEQMKDPRVTDTERRNYFLGEIYKLINYRPKGKA